MRAISLTRKEKILAYLAFQVTWFSCVMTSTAVFLPLSLMALFYYLYLLRKIQFPVFIPLSLALSGFCLDLLWQSLAWIQFASQGTKSSPLFLLFLWLAFILSIPIIMQPVLKRKLWAVLLVFSVPFSYLAGQNFDVLQYCEPEWRAMLAQILSYLILLFLYQQVWKLYVRKQESESSHYLTRGNSSPGEDHGA